MQKRENKLSPLNRPRINAFLIATAIAGSFTILMKVYFGVPFSYVHWWIFGFAWFPSLVGVVAGNSWRKSLRYMNRETGSDVFRYIERDGRK